MYQPEFLDSINISGLLPHELKLKIGAPIMLIRNLDHNSSYCNGMRNLITAINSNLKTDKK